LSRSTRAQSDSFVARHEDHVNAEVREDTQRELELCAAASLFEIGEHSATDPESVRGVALKAQGAGAHHAHDGAHFVGRDHAHPTRHGIGGRRVDAAWSDLKDP
jgi:hypothetical protein